VAGRRLGLALPCFRQAGGVFGARWSGFSGMKDRRPVVSRIRTDVSLWSSIAEHIPGAVLSNSPAAEEEQKHVDQFQALPECVDRRGEKNFFDATAAVESPFYGSNMFIAREEEKKFTEELV